MRSATVALKKLISDRKFHVIRYVRRPDGGSIRSYIVKVKDDNGIKYGIKFFSSSDLDAKDRFLKEIRIIKKLRNKLPAKYRMWVVNIRWYSSSENYPYYIYDYVEGESIGKFVEDFGIKWGLFNLKNFKDFIKFLDVLSGLDMEEVDEDVGNWGLRTARKEIQYYFENVKGLLPAKMYDEVQSFIEKYGERAFKYRLLSHRDLYPENILLKEKFTSSFTFLDFEYLSRVPIGFDAAFMYLLFWREEYWKSKVLSYYYNKYLKKGRSSMLSHFNTSFRFCLVVLAIRFIYQIDSFGDKKKQDYENAKESFLYDLQSALEGKIIKPRNIKFYLEECDIQKVADVYRVGKVKNYEIFYASKGNTVAKVRTTAGTYVFRFYSMSRSKSLIKKELRLIKILCDGGVKTYRIIPTKEGDLFTGVKLYGKKRNVAVMTFLNGKKINRQWANENSARQAGAMLRKIHDCNVIHGDYSKENVLFIKSKVSGVIDFEWGRVTKSREAKLHDLAKAMALWIIDIRLKKIGDEIFIKNFLEGYYGKLPSKGRLRKIISVVIDKIEDERSIFLTTIDKRRSNGVGIGKRFDSGIRKVSEFLETYK